MAKRGTNLAEFKKGLERGDAELRTEYRKMVRALMLDLLTGVTSDTPVDTGLLRSNWQVGIDEEPNGQLEISSPETVLAAGIAKLNRLPNPYGITIYIVNNVRYASYVEYGTPFMAPRSMLTKNILRLGGVA